MSRLLVNPGNANAWEIQLKPGTNSLGRGETNDFVISDPSVSGSHCQIIVGASGAVIKDLGSTNGTYINRAAVQTAVLQHGQHIHLGGVEMLFEADGQAPAPVAASAPASAPAPAVRITIASKASQPALPTAPPPVPTVRLSVAHAEPPAPPPAPAAAPAVAAAPAPAVRFTIPSKASQPALATAPPSAPAVRLSIARAEPPTPPPAAPPPLPAEAVAPPVAPMSVGTAFCKSHTKTAARYYCPHCAMYFCDLCVSTSRTGGAAMKSCRRCGHDVTPVQVHLERPKGPQGFFTRLPGAVVYPFRGSGVLVLIVATLIFAALGAMSGIFSLICTMLAIGYLFTYMQSIIHCTASGDNEMASLPAFDGLFGAFFTFAGTVLFCFGLPIALLVLKLALDMEIPVSVLIAAMVLSCLYFPMAFLAVAMKDSVLAANPLVVIPAMLKVPVEYIVTAILMASIFLVERIGDAIAGGAQSVTYTTRDMNVLLITFGIRAAWSFISVYLLSVNMRVLGLLYLTKKDKLGWFSH